MNKSKTLTLVRAVVLYVSGLNHGPAMDDLTMECTDYEWKLVCDALDLADEVEVDSGIGTVYQVEKVLAKREKREDRYPSCLLLYGLDEETSKRNVKYQIDKLAREFTKKGIKFFVDNPLEISRLFAGSLTEARAAYNALIIVRNQYDSVASAIDEHSDLFKDGK